MVEFIAPTNKKVELFIPIACRQRLKWKSGEKLIIRIENGELYIASEKHFRKKSLTKTKTN